MAMATATERAAAARPWRWRAREKEERARIVKERGRDGIRVRSRARAGARKAVARRVLSAARKPVRGIRAYSAVAEKSRVSRKQRSEALRRWDGGEAARSAEFPGRRASTGDTREAWRAGHHAANPAARSPARPAARRLQGFTTISRMDRRT